MFSIEKELLKEMTNDIEIRAYEEDFIEDVDDILEDYVLGLDEDINDIQLEDVEFNLTDLDSLII